MDREWLYWQETHYYYSILRLLHIVLSKEGTGATVLWLQVFTEVSISMTLFLPLAPTRNAFGLVGT